MLHIKPTWMPTMGMAVVFAAWLPLSAQAVDLLREKALVVPAQQASAPSLNNRAVLKAVTAEPVSPQQRRDTIRALLKSRGVEFVQPSRNASGLAPQVLARQDLVGELLNAMRAEDPSQRKGQTLYRLTFPADSDKETMDALKALQASGNAASLTASDALFNDVERGMSNRQCQTAAVAMDREELNIRAIASDEPTAEPGSAAFWALLEHLNPKALERFRAAAQQFAGSCMDTQLTALTPPQRTALEGVLGVMMIDDLPGCMATRVRADTVLTARHCLYQYDDAIGWTKRSFQTLRFVLAGRPGVPVAMSEIDCTAAAAEPACAEFPRDPVAADHLLLRVAVPKGSGKASWPPMPALSFQVPRPHQFLVVPGWSTWFTGRPWRAQDRLLATAPAIGGCLVKSIRDACVINACQSDSGFSGAPILARQSSDRLIVVGVFLGAATAYPACQRTQHNFGTTLPAFLARNDTRRGLR